MSNINEKREAISSFINFFEHSKLDLNDEQTVSFLDLLISKFLESELNSLGFSSNCIIDFYDNPQDTRSAFLVYRRKIKRDRNSYILAESEITPEIKINRQTLYKDLCSDDPKVRRRGAEVIFQTLLHELTHLKQHLNINDNVSSIDTINCAEDFALQESEQDSYINLFYNYCFTEKNAETTSLHEYQEIMGFHKDFDNLIYIESSKEIIGRYINKTFDKLQELICNQNRIDLLLYYPVLQREFNFDGTVKTPDQLIEDMDAQYSRIFFSQELSIKEKNILINQSSEMYFELLYRSFSNLSKEEIDESLKNIEPDTIERIFNLMKNHFELDKLNSLRTLDSAEKALKDCDNQTIPSNLDSQISQIKLLLINEANQRIKFIDIIISENLDLDER